MVRNGEYFKEDPTLESLVKVVGSVVFLSCIPVMIWTMFL
jgi:hypothetical protein